MAMTSTPSFPWVIDKLADEYGPAVPPFPTDAFELVLWENVAYLGNDEKKQKALESLRATVGTRPEQIINATPDQLVAVASHGILAKEFGAKIRLAAEIALGDFDGDLDEVVGRPVALAKRALRRFPGIAEPGSEKILLFLRIHPSLAPESNALRVLVRLGLCPEGGSYATTYSAARDAAQRELGSDFDALLRARYYLRRHGKEICRNKAPSCVVCPLNQGCPFPYGDRLFIVRCFHVG